VQRDAGLGDELTSGEGLARVDNARRVLSQLTGDVGAGEPAERWFAAVALDALGEGPLVAKPVD
jgi:hypothetical protein